RESPAQLRRRASRRVSQGGCVVTHPPCSSSCSEFDFFFKREFLCAFETSLFRFGSVDLDFKGTFGFYTRFFFVFERFLFAFFLFCNKRIFELWFINWAHRYEEGAQEIDDHRPAFDFYG